MPQQPDAGLDHRPQQQADTGTKRSRGIRAAVACDSCRTRKVKCDGEFPCTSCTQNTFDCSYKDRRPYIGHAEPQRPDHGSQISAIKSQLQSRPSSWTEASLATPRREIRPATTTSLEREDSVRSVSSVAAAVNAPGSPVSERTAALPADDSAAATLGELNKHTGGNEFYGPASTFFFLAKLRSHANSGYPPTSALRDDGNTENSVVNLLHSSDYTSPPQLTKAEGGEPADRQVSLPGDPTPIQGRDVLPEGSSTSSDFEVAIQRECVRLFFENLHSVHPILDRASFLALCEKHVWSPPEHHDTTPTHRHRRDIRRFRALLHVVLAIGAVTAGETSLLTEDRTVAFLRAEGADSPPANSSPFYPPLRVALLYFDKARALISDVFESTSFETVQTLFLMAVFCQNALKPHSCYMYAGMAIRTALAIGIPTAKRATSEQERLLWWALYSFEIEMSSSSGRQPFLQSPAAYGIPLPTVTAQGSTAAPFVNCMVDLARVLADVAASTDKFAVDDDDTDTDANSNTATIADKSRRAAELEGRLEAWKAGLPRVLDFRTSSLTESEVVIKQKTVLKLRTLNFRVLIHRPFLLLNTSEPDNRLLGPHVSSCVEAARELIRFVYETYLYRPYFRTWWYNCTYVLDATMVLLYVALTNTCPLPVDVILGDIDKSLEIFAAMSCLAVARRCAEIIREVLDGARRAQQRQQYGHGTAAAAPDRGVQQGSGGGGGGGGGDGAGEGGFVPHEGPVAQGPTAQAQMGAVAFNGPDGGGLGASEMNQFAPGPDGHTYEDLYASLVDANMVYNFLNFEDWNAWAGVEGGMGQG